MSVHIYADEGVSASSLEELTRHLHHSLPHPVHQIDRHFFLTPNWEQQTTLLVFPGGRDLPYHTHLSGEANRRIATFVQHGGAYLGICAGGYYAASEIEFEKGGPLEICGPRELAFFPGKAVGPAYGPGQFAYDSEQGAQIAPLSWEEGVAEIYYNGGCYFEKAEHYPHIEILARYHALPQTPAAVIRCQFGRGRALLTGVHPEFPTDSCEQTRTHFLKYLLNKLLST